MESETLFIPLADGLQAIVKIKIQEEGVHPMDRPTFRQPTLRELHHLAEKLFHRAYQFHPED